MKYTTLLTFVICLPATAQSVHWEFSESTGGENVFWVSSTAVDPNADQYDYVYDITYIAVDVVFLGIVYGPVDVTNDIDPDLRHGSGNGDGPAPIVIMNDSIAADADDDGDIDVAADLFMQLNAEGFGQFDITNVYLGDVWVELPWPFGWQEVDIDRIYLEGSIDITPIVIPCPEDTNGDGLVDVTDILTAIGNWGGSGEGDVNGDGVVDVSDLLAMVGAWGPCQ